MNTTLITAGIAFIAAAIVGGGLKAFGVEVPAFASIKRQLLLAVFGGVLILAALVKHPVSTSREAEAWNSNPAAPIPATTIEASSSDSGDYPTAFQADRTNELRLAKDGEKA